MESAGAREPTINAANGQAPIVRNESFLSHESPIDGTRTKTPTTNAVLKSREIGEKLERLEGISSRYSKQTQDYKTFKEAAFKRVADLMKELETAKRTSQPGAQSPQLIEDLREARGSNAILQSRSVALQSRVTALEEEARQTTATLKRVKDGKDSSYKRLITLDAQNAALKNAVRKSSTAVWGNVENGHRETEELRAALKIVEEELAQLKVSAPDPQSTVDHENTQLRRALSSAKADLSTYKGSAERADQEIREFLQRLKILSCKAYECDGWKDFTSHHPEVDSLQAGFRLIERIYQRYRDMEADHLHEKESIEREQQVMETDHDAKQEVGRLGVELANINKQRLEARQVAENANHAAAATLSRLQSAQSQIKALRADLNNAQTTIEKNIENGKRTVEVDVTSKLAIETLEAGNSRLQEEAASLKLTIEQLKTKNSELRTIVMESQSHIHKIQMEVRQTEPKTQEALNSLEEQSRGKEYVIGELRGQVAERSTQVSSLESNLAMMKDRLRSAEIAYETLVAAEKTLRDDHARLQSDMTYLHEHTARTKRDYDQLLEDHRKDKYISLPRYEQLRNQHSEQKEICDQMSGELQELRSKNEASASHREQTLEQENQRLDQTLRAQQSITCKYQSSLDRAQRTISEQVDRLRRYENDWEATGPKVQGLIEENYSRGFADGQSQALGYQRRGAEQVSSGNDPDLYLETPHRSQGSLQISNRQQQQQQQQESQEAQDEDVDMEDVGFRDELGDQDSTAVITYSSSQFQPSSSRHEHQAGHDGIGYQELSTNEPEPEPVGSAGPGMLAITYPQLRAAHDEDGTSISPLSDAQHSVTVQSTEVPSIIKALPRVKSNTTDEIADVGQPQRKSNPAREGKRSLEVGEDLEVLHDHIEAPPMLRAGSEPASSELNSSSKSEESTGNTARRRDSSPAPYRDGEQTAELRKQRSRNRARSASASSTSSQHPLQPVVLRRSLSRSTKKAINYHEKHLQKKAWGKE